MGILSDVPNAINDLIEPTEGLGRTLVEPQIDPLLHQVRETLVELQQRMLFTHFQSYR